jgi:hypothetical protein
MVPTVSLSLNMDPSYFLVLASDPTVLLDNVADGAQVSCGGYYKNTDYVVAANPTWVNGRCGRR